MTTVRGTMIASLLLISLAAAPAPLSTVSERSAWVSTGRYDEVVSLCHAFEKRYPGHARCQTFGQTPEGRPMLALVVSSDGTLDPAAARAKQRPVVLFQGGIHAGEIDGKDAGFWVVRDLLAGKSVNALLGKITAVFVPVFNVDGHERFGPNHRPNQVGPKEMGWRVTAQDYNLNRDYMKADAPEMRAMLALLTSWDPILYLDLHVTDGAQFQPDVSVLIQAPQGFPALQASRDQLEAELFPRLKAQGHQPLDFYPSFEKDSDPASGFSRNLPPPRFSQGYWSQRHRLAVLVETHSWKSYAERVKTTHDVVQGFLELAAKDGARWKHEAGEADAATQRFVPKELALAFRHTDKKETLAYPGYAYTLASSPLTGEDYVVYDVQKPQTWNIPLYPELRPAIVATLPRAGYLVPRAWAPLVASKLRAHGVAFTPLGAAQVLNVEVYRATEVKFSSKSFEGHQALEVNGAWHAQKAELLAGSLYVPLAQPTQELIAQLLEPRGPDSLLAWGFFNNAFEQKEYLEPYVLEPWAKGLLDRDPAVKTEFERRMKTDKAFAASSAERVRFFAERHPAWDERLELYPVLRVDAPVRP